MRITTSGSMVKFGMLGLSLTLSLDGLAVVLLKPNGLYSGSKYLGEEETLIPPMPLIISYLLASAMKVRIRDLLLFGSSSYISKSISLGSHSKTLVSHLSQSTKLNILPQFGQG
jgi:hypothetical protein